MLTGGEASLARGQLSVLPQVGGRGTGGKGGREREKQSQTGLRNSISGRELCRPQ